MEIGDPEWMGEVGWPMLLVVFLFIASLYLWSYLSRNLERMKGVEGKFFDNNLINYLERMTKALIVIFLTILSLYALSLIWTDFNEELWEPSLQYTIDIVVISMIFLLAVFLVQVIRRVALSHRMSNEGDETGTKGVVQVILLTLGYFIYVIATIISVVIITGALYPDTDVEKASVDFLSEHGNVIISVLAIVIAVFFATKLVEEILEDYKFKTKKFNPQVVDLFKKAIGYVLWTIAIITITYSLFALFNLKDVGLLLVGLLIMFIVIAALTSYHTLKNISAGIALMSPSIYDLNERIIVDDGLEGDVVQKNLMFTEIRLTDGTFVNVPNGRLIDTEIFNVSRSGGIEIVVIVPMPFSTPHAEVEALINKALEKVGGLSDVAPLSITVIDMEDNKMFYQVKVRTDDFINADKIRSDVLVNLQEVLHQAGYENLS
ncbi:MAG: mechanosensitive ion channel family protein [Euryarchaeota archaeon]|nr:mechanosensitive ion channel family protein [Euryarchaeota archaeon]